MKVNRLTSLCIEICKLINNINPTYINEIFQLRKISRAVRGNYKLNDTHRKRQIFHSIQYRNGWLGASDLFDMFTQSIKFYIFHYQYRCLKIVIHQIDSKNGWLLLSVSFTAKRKHWKTVFLRSFIFKPTENIGSSKKRYQEFSKQPSIEEISMFLCDDQWKL